AVASGLLSASVVASASSAGSLLPDLVASAPVLASELVQGDVVDHDAAVAGAMSMQFYRITDHDRMWDLAGQNDAVLQRILEMNADQVKSPIDFRPGMTIRVPVSLNLPDAVSDEAELDPGAAAGDASDSADGNTVYEVVEGDNLWNISKIRLAEAAEGERPSNQEILEEVTDVVERNPDVIEDPDLIYPGELLTLRSVEDSVTAGSESEVVAEASADLAEETGDDTATEDEATEDDAIESRPVEAETGSPAVEPTTIESVPVEPTTIESVPVASTTIQSIPVDSSTGGASGAAAAMADEPEINAPAEAPSAAPWLLGGAALSSALLGLYLVGRRQAGGFTVGFSRKAVDDGPETPPLLQAIARTADPRFMTWVARRLDDTLAGHGTSAAFPTAMLVTPGRRLEMQWPNPVVLTAPKWGMVDGEGRRWACDYDPDHEAAPSEPPTAPGPMTTAALPAMLSLGRVIDEGPAVVGFEGAEPLDGTELLVNVEHFGSIAVCGSTGHVFSAVRAMIFELAAGAQVCRTQVTTVDFEVEGAEILPAIDSARESEALEMAAAPADTGSTLRVFVVHATFAQLDQWFELAKPGTGVALILIGDVRSSRLGSRYVLDDNGTGEFHGLQRRVRVFGLESSTALAIEELFRAPEPTGEPVADSLRSMPVGSFEPSGG
ncbi:MAG: hypothetical protein OEZ14_15220, partial [Acidimicrobiia bacterium]|nr:hypothetical protein [Acidimicrobiia bacterium]